MNQHMHSESASEEEYRNIFEAAGDGLVIHDIATDVVVDANDAACEMHGYPRREFIGLHPVEFMLPESHTLYMEHTLKVEGVRAFEALAVHVRKDGTPFHVEASRSMIRYRGRLCLLSMMRDVSQRVQKEALLNKEVQDRMREQATLLAISHTLASTLELQPGLILDQLREIIEYNHAGLFSLEELNMVTLAMRGTEQLEQSAPLLIHVDEPEKLEALFNRHRPIRIGNVWSEDTQAIFLRELLDDSSAALLKGMSSWMWVPLAVRGRIIGGIGVAHDKPKYFTAHHADLALSVANQAAITMINVELYDHAQALAVMEERQRLARNLHDAINQSLFSAGLIAEVLPRLWERDQAEARRSLADLRRLTRGAQAEMRALLAELRPSTLTDSNLGDLLHLLGAAHSGRTNVPVNVTVEDEFNLPSEVQVTFYRVCQEALYNSAKHAEASQVEIVLKKDEDVIELSIRDDGKGFDIGQDFSGHYGLSMMRERAEAVRAVLSIDSAEGSGTKLIMRWGNKESI